MIRVILLRLVLGVRKLGNLVVIQDGSIPDIGGLPTLFAGDPGIFGQGGKSVSGEWRLRIRVSIGASYPGNSLGQPPAEDRVALISNTRRATRRSRNLNKQQP